MVTDDTRYPILVDTDALIAVANSSLWAQITDHIGLTTTNVCKQELERHVENTRETTSEGSRPYRLNHGSRAAFKALEDNKIPLTQVTSVPRLSSRGKIPVISSCNPSIRRRLNPKSRNWLKNGSPSNRILMR